VNLPKISVWSQFRNAAGQQIELYRWQIENVDYPPELIRLYLCEGDSEDDTLAQLREWAINDNRIRIIKHDTGIPHFAHSPRRERMKAVSENGNKGWAAIREDAWGDYALMLESDLMYDYDLLRSIIERRPIEADIFAPMIWILVDGELRFYDIWAYRKNGKMFQPNSPEWYFAHYGSGLLEVDSVGSVVLFKMNLILEGLRLGEADCVLGMCNKARKCGYRVFCDPTINILHPHIQGVA
jgi:hypothetical protein